MKNLFTTKQWIVIDFILFLIILAFTIVIVLAPSYDASSLNITDSFKADFGAYHPPLPLWKNICLVIDIVLLVVYYFIYFVFCRCPFCKKHIHVVRGGFCPYCSKNLNFTADEAMKIKKNK